MRTFYVTTFLLTVLGAAATGCATREARTAEPMQLAADARVACAEVPETARQELHARLADVDFSHVERIEGRRRVGRTTVPTTAGARIFLKAQPGMTVPWLQRVVACEAAAVASGGVTAPTSIFGVPDTMTDVRAAYGGFTIEVKALNGEDSREVHRRALAMTTRKSSTTGVAQNESTPTP